MTGTRKARYIREIAITTDRVRSNGSPIIRRYRIDQDVAEISDGYSQRVIDLESLILFVGEETAREMLKTGNAWEDDDRCIEVLGTAIA